jgi:protocatechuate 3,4-dioxygenase beta subunit
VASGLVTCVLSPEMTEGPYYVEGDKVRRNITEGKPGVPLILRLTVVNVSTCRPIRGAAVDIRHCDAGGVYSGTSVQSTENLTFLRGIQRTDTNGLAIFRTIYPGWYPGRTVTRGSPVARRSLKRGRVRAR